MAKGTPCRPEMCETCIFRPAEEGGLILRPGRIGEIQRSLIMGRQHNCHHAEFVSGKRAKPVVCRGAREYQLRAFVNMRLISEPTDEALAQAMAAVGVTPIRVSRKSKGVKENGEGS